MEVTAAVTLWICFSGFLIFPVLGAPRLLGRASASLLSAELLALLIWSYGSQGCTQRPCGAVAETARTAAAQDVPGLTAALVVLAVAYGIRVARS